MFILPNIYFTNRFSLQGVPQKSITLDYFWPLRPKIWYSNTTLKIMLATFLGTPCMLKTYFLTWQPHKKTAFCQSFTFCHLYLNIFWPDSLIGAFIEDDSLIAGRGGGSWQTWSGLAIIIIDGSPDYSRPLNLNINGDDYRSVVMISRIEQWLLIRGRIG